MAVDQATQKQIGETVQHILSLRTGEDLVSRPSSWGTITFEEAKDDLEMVFFIAEALDELPIHQMPQGSANEIDSALSEVNARLNGIDGFTVEQDNPQQQRNQLIKQLGTNTERLYNAAMPHIAFLTVRRGDVAERLAQLEGTIGRGETLIAETKANLEGKVAELESIAASAKEAAAATGAAVFTGEFGTEASNQIKTARLWLAATAVLATLTVMAAVWYWPDLGDNPKWWDVVRAATSKLALLALLFTATIWCGRIVRARYHQATVNKHRSLGLKTFQAFVGAARDDRTKDAVLIEATRSIFGDVPTGFVEGGSGADEPSMRFVEIGKSITENTKTATE